MTESTDVAPRQSTDVSTLTDDALIAASKGQADASDLIIPILKVGQPLTREVSNGDAAAGEFINGLTGETFGDTIGFIICNTSKGRFASPKDSDRAYVAQGQNIPASWGPLLGEQYVDTPFSEHPESEERYRARVNAGDIEWGSGPLISTTYNFTGYIVTEDDDEQPPIPVRLSLMRTQVKAAKKLNTMVQFLRAPWDVVFDLSTAREQGGKGTYYLVTVKQGRKTTPDERQEATNLARVLLQGQATFAGEDAIADPKDEAAAPAAAPTPQGALDLD